MTAPPSRPCLGLEDVADLVAYLAGRGSPVSGRQIDDHVEACPRCRDLLSHITARAAAGSAAAAAPLRWDEAVLAVKLQELLGLGPTRTAANGAPTFADLLLPPRAGEDEVAIGQRVGRYRVLGRIGAGGMGVVYAAHDPELDRKVAIKLLRTDIVRPQGQAWLHNRLLREAQAMAQLAHPNVVAVHDVGNFEDSIFIAMEFVAGRTLAQWLVTEPRAARDVIAHFLAAGRGLAAAHAAGVVHRDFKPSNVLVGDDGRVRVTDFGLARLAALSEHGAAIGHVPASDLAAARSVTASVVEGTPLYMAPEQHLGAATDARTDQFSFCVALYSSLAGEHPFEATTPDDVAAAVTRGNLRPPRRRGSLNRRVRRVLLRGLSVEPEKRHPSMEALLADLERDPHRLTRPVLAGVLALLLLAVALLYPARQASSPCGDAEGELAGVWNEAAAAAVDHAFRATSRPFAVGSYREVSRTLDGFVGGWAAMRVEACEATRVRGEQSEELLELRTSCLDESLRLVRAMVQSFARADAAIVERAPRSVRILTDLSACQDARTLLGPVPPPRQPEARARAAALRVGLAEVKVLRQAGRTRDALAHARELARAAAELRYRPLEAEILLELGGIEREGGDADASARTLERAVWAAEAGRHDPIAARAWTGLMAVRGHDQGRPADALDLEPRVTAILERMKGDDELEGMLHLTTSALLAGPRLAEAEKEARRALTLLERRFGREDPRVADALDAVADLAVARGRSGRAELDGARSIKEAVYGAEHPEHGRALRRLGDAFVAEARYEEARAALEKAMAIAARALGPQHQDVGAAAGSLAAICRSTGRRRPSSNPSWARSRSSQNDEPLMGCTDNFDDL